MKSSNSEDKTIPELSTCRRCHLCAGSLRVSLGVASLIVVFRRFCLEDLESHATDLLAMQRRYGVLGTVTTRKLRIAIITTYNMGICTPYSQQYT